MFHDYAYLVVTLSMIFIIGLIAGVLWFTKTYSHQEKMMFMFMLIVTILISVFVVDNVVAYKFPLLSEQEDSVILQAMTDIIKFTLGALLGSKITSKDELPKI